MMTGHDFNILGKSYDAPMRMGLGATVMDADVDATAPEGATDAVYVHPTDSYTSTDPTLGTPEVHRPCLNTFMIIFTDDDSDSSDSDNAALRQSY